jgi:exopolysaccharide biosynthesis polyprenyl glycosylphosphotransferase
MSADSLLVASSFLLSGLSASAAPRAGWQVLVLAIATFLVASTSLGLYRVIGSVPARVQAILAARAYLGVVAVMLVVHFLAGSPHEHRGQLVAFFLLTPALYAAAWVLLRMVLRGLRARHFGRWRTLILGVDTGMERVLGRVRAIPELGYEIVRIVKAAGVPGGLFHFDPAMIEQSIVEDGIELILLSSSYVDASLERLEDICRERQVGIRILSRESDELFVRCRIYDLAGIPLVWPEPRPVERLKRIVKRVFDIVLSGILVTVLAPVFLSIAIAAKLESAGPVLFRQKRALGGDDAPFEFFKFRSMLHLSETEKGSLAEKNESDGLLFKIRNDPRRTRVGRFIRRHSLDELPQLLNVLRGEMSLVGPRPLPLEDFALLRERDHLQPYVRQRARARPGMTGLWQISGRSDLGFREMVLLDLYYVQHQNILFDLEILFRTLPVVLFGRGAY